jgi:hypothetical protein
MHWPHLIAYFFGGVFLTNALPHLVQGLSGRAFQSPFGKPPGKGESSSLSNSLWGILNLVIAYALILKVGAFDLRYLPHAVALLLGATVVSAQLSLHMGQFHGGAKPRG